MILPTYAKKANKILDRIISEGVDVKGKVVQADVFHNKWCPIYLGSSSTNCLCNGQVEITVNGTIYREE